MTFEEFFKKKKIDLLPLQQGEPALFSEFKTHYEQMGEKSFDHSKKYWFNQLRRRFPAPPEVKPEKVVIENQLAEQTIADTLTEPAAPSASVGFKPRFKTAMAAKPGEEKPAEPVVEISAPEDEKPATPVAGFKPRFKASMVAKPAEEQVIEPAPEIPAVSEEEKPATPAVGFKPRFKASIATKPVADEPEKPANPEVKEENPATEQPAEPVAKPVGFKPRFNAKNFKPKEPEE